MRAKSACLALMLLAGCSTPGENRLAERDPLEKFNRGVWQFNQAVDKAALRPTTMVYRTVTPVPARRGISSALSNLSEPFSFVNNLLQGKPKRAARNLERFLINSTIGVGGLADHATNLGVASAGEDFGQTLAVWGANGGPYLVLPILGPSTLRDGVGQAVALFADPYQITKRSIGLTTTELYGIYGAQVIIIRSNLIDSGTESFLKTSLDPYAAARSAYLQRRAAQIRDTENDPTAGAVDDMSADSAPEAVGAEQETTPPAPQ